MNFSIRRSSLVSGAVMLWSGLIPISLGAVAAGASTGAHLVSEREGALVVQIDPSEAPVTPESSVRFFVAVPAGARVSASVLGERFEDGPVSEAAKRSIDRPLEPGEPRRPHRPRGAGAVVISEPFVYRHTRIVGLECAVRSYDPENGTMRRWSSYQVRVTWPVPGRSRRRGSVDPLVARLVVNRDLFPAPLPGGAVPAQRGGSAARGAAAGVDPFFSLSPNWLRVRIDERGVYRITGAELAARGVSLSSINDPGTFRVFSLGSVEQRRSFSDPEGSWRVGRAFHEVAILVEDGGDGTFDPGDRIVFYALGAEGWRDWYDPTAPDTSYYEHYRDTKNYYYVTWDGAFSGGAARMASRAAAPGPGPDRTTYRERRFVEKDLVSDLDYRGDGWLWVQFPRTGFGIATLENVRVDDLVPSVPQEFRTIALAPYDINSRVFIRDNQGQVIDTVYVNEQHHVVYKVVGGGGTRTVGEYIWDAARTDRNYEDGKPVAIPGAFLNEGFNTFVVEVPRDLNLRDSMNFAWFALSYERRLRAVSGALGFSTPDTAGTVTFSVGGFAPGETIYAFDVTDWKAPERLTGVSVVSSTARFSSAPSGTRRHIWVAADGALKAPGSIARISPTDLRAAADGPNMLIVAPEAFRSSAEALRSHRARHLPFYSAPGVEVATMQNIYDNFSGGQSDPMAIRNYIKFLYENFTDGSGNSKLAYVALLGDATVDFKHHASQVTDWVPTNLNFTRQSNWSFATDAWYGHMDAADQTPGMGAGDVAIGRLPAASSGEAAFLVDKVIGYETRSPFEDWRNEIILVADDEKSSFPGCSDQFFTEESEFITYFKVPQYIDVLKVYLTEFERVSGLKPESRTTLLDKWNDGAIVINYIGHGSSQQMADEQVFLGSDASLLDNGYKLPILMAFSCTVGDFANALDKSLSERLMLKEGGGVIGTITASNLTFIFNNDRLNMALFETMVPRRTGVGLPIGGSLATARLASLVQAFNSPGQEDNNWKYNLLCDPALTLAVPGRDVRFDASLGDTLTAGIRRTIRGRVFTNGLPDTTFTGTALVTVREPDYRRKYITDCGSFLFYRYAAGTIYRGRTPVTNGRFGVDFRVPRFARTGPLAYVTTYATSSSGDAAASEDSLYSLAAPTPADSAALRALDGPPRVDIGFKSGLKTVKPGESLQAVVRDQDGVNILSTTNEGRHSLLIDRAPVPIDVTEFFEFDDGGSDTSGVLVYPLPELDVGAHRAIYKVSDTFGQTTLDTIQFSVTDPLDYFAEVVLNYPNPFRDQTQFMLRLSDRASIRLDIFTVSGKRIRRIEENRDAGRVWIRWDGRDAVGDRIANGTYLYVATVDFAGIDRTPLVLRGKLSKLE